jgi:ATP-binding cassette subfamily C protein
MRLVGILLALAAFGVVALDVACRLLAPAGHAVTTLYDAWIAVHPAGPAALRGLLADRADWVVSALDSVPAALPLLAAAYLCWRIGRRRQQRRGAAGRPEPHAGAAREDGAGADLSAALASCRGAFATVGMLSGVSNLLMLTGSIFMLQIYDRVLPSRSVPTLVALAMLAAFLFVFQGVIDLIRGRILIRIGASLDQALTTRVYDSVVRLPLATGKANDGLQPLRDLDSVRAFLAGPGPAAFFDLPWLPLYLAIIFAFHFLIGVTAAAGAAVLVALALLTEAFTRGPTRASAQHAAARLALAEASRRNAEALAAMGMHGRMAARWNAANARYMASQHAASDVAGGLGAISRILRLMLQSAVLAVGAYLVLLQEATAGIIIAASILAARALAPVDLAIANWRGFVAARHGWQRLGRLLAALPAPPAPLSLPPPRATVAVEALSGVPPGSQTVAVRDVAFSLQAGQGLAVIGPSAAGKSTLARVLVGAWQPARGTIRLDGAALDQWPPAMRGRHIGYLPQDVELFAGTIAENIARFDADATPAAIVAAAQAAGVHDLILLQPNGYDTQIGEHGAALSAGQRQRVALARALYGDPFLVVLDEPNSNLDAEGDAALTQAILDVRARGGIVIVIAHRPSAMAGIDLVLAMQHGRMIAFGPKDEVLPKVLRPVGGPASASAKPPHAAVRRQQL